MRELMREAWITQEQDMEIARDIINDYYDETDDEVDIEEIRMIPEGSLMIERAPWVLDLEDEMESRYGQDKGIQVAAKVMTLLMAEGEAIH